MCGVPWQSADHHIAKLIAAGRKVAVCDQMEEARGAKGLVRRDITRVVTPGTVLDPNALLPAVPSYLAAAVPGNDVWEVALLDLSTGRSARARCPPAASPDLFALCRPRELLLPEGEEPPLPLPGIARTAAPVRVVRQGAERPSRARRRSMGRGPRPRARPSCTPASFRPARSSTSGPPSRCVSASA